MMMRPVRFPGFDVSRQAPRWDAVTRATIEDRVATTVAEGFFTDPERRAARRLLGRLLDLDGEALESVLALVEQRLALGRQDGWRYADLPEDGAAWRGSLARLDRDAQLRCGAGFVEIPNADADALICALRERDGAQWHGWTARHVWSLWTRYACTALYSHPRAWDPRGYKNANVDGREPFEVKDHHNVAP